MIEYSANSGSPSARPRPTGRASCCYGAAAMPSGTRISFEPGTDTTVVDACLGGVWGSVTPVVLVRPDWSVQNVGTAFCIVSLLSDDVVYLTARHVVEGDGSGRHDRAVFVLMHRRDHPDPLALTGVPVRSISLSENFSDVAILVANASDTPIPAEPPSGRLPLGFMEPQVGDEVLAIGFPHTSEWTDGFHSLSVAPVATHGVVTNIYPRHRDQGLVTFPAIGTTARFQPAMSGGPILNRNGYAVGVIGTGLNGDGPPYGTGALSAAVAELAFDVIDDGGQLVRTSVNTLRQNANLIVGGDATLLRDEAGVTISWVNPSAAASAGLDT